MQKRHRNWGTISIICIIFLIFLIDTFLLSTNIFTKAHMIYGNDYGLITKYGMLLNVKKIGYEWWRLFSNIFIHAGIPHLLVNIIALYLVGMQIERNIGSKSFIITFCIIGTLSSCITMFFTNGAVGASGAIYGLCGIYIEQVLTKKMKLTGVLSIVVFILILLYLVLPNLSTNTAIVAHIVGFLCGLLFEYFSKILLHKNGSH